MTWGDKTPEYVDVFEELALRIPQAKFIFLARDGRDVVNSLLQRGWQGWSLYQRSLYWTNAILKMDKFKNRNGQRSFWVNYEDLVRNPEEALRNICAFLNVNYAPAMLTYHESSNQRITEVERQQGIHQKMHRLPKMSDIQKWKQTDGPQQTFYGEAFMHKGLLKAGYQLFQFNPGKLSHQMQYWMLKIRGITMSRVYRFYHHALGQRFKSILRNSTIGLLLKKIVRST